MVNYRNTYECLTLQLALHCLFACASCTKDASHLCYNVDLVFGKVMKGNHFNPFSWASHRSTRQAKSTPAAKMLAASEAIQEIVMLKNAQSKLTHLKIATMLIVDSKDLYRTLSSKLNTIDKFVRRDVNAMTFYFDTVVDFFRMGSRVVKPC